MPRKALEPIRLDAYRPLRDVVCEALRAAIQSGELPPGERLMEIPLAEELGVSRTPIREAIRKLEQEGFVVMIPRRGTYVADITLKDINQVFEIRSSLEELAASLASERITPDELEELERHLVSINDYMESRDFDKIVAADIAFHEVLYIALLYVTAGVSFGAYQVRIATAFYAMSYIFPFLVIPMGLANFIANAFGGLGLIDMEGHNKSGNS